MIRTMKAAVLLGKGELEIREIPVPQPGEGEILVKVRAATTCGTDLKIFLRGHPKFPPPFVFGHEFGGEVVAAGKGVEKFWPGMRVTANVFGECGECFFCQKGQGNLCENLEYNFGAFAEYHLIPASIVRQNVFEISDHLSYAEAAVVEPLVCVVHAADLVNVQPGERVVVIGAGGPISLLFLQLLKLAGASQVIAIGHSDLRLSLAQKLGSDIVINAKNEDVDRAVMDMTNGRGADVVIECAGQLETWLSAVRLVRRGGRVLWFGGLPGGTQVPIDAGRVHYGQIQLLNSHGGTAKDASRAFDLIVNGEINTKALISKEMGLSEIDQALNEMIGGRVVKIALNPDF